VDALCREMPADADTGLLWGQCHGVAPRKPAGQC
jgi:hypothetical protein